MASFRLEESASAFSHLVEKLMVSCTSQRTQSQQSRKKKRWWERWWKKRKEENKGHAERGGTNEAKRKERRKRRRKGGSRGWSIWRWCKKGNKRRTEEEEQRKKGREILFEGKPGSKGRYVGKMEKCMFLFFWLRETLEWRMRLLKTSKTKGGKTRTKDRSEMRKLAKMMGCTLLK